MYVLISYFITPDYLPTVSQLKCKKRLKKKLASGFCCLILYQNTPSIYKLGVYFTDVWFPSISHKLFSMVFLLLWFVKGIISTIFDFG